MEGYWPNCIDHIDHDGLNNKWYNLRNTTRAENQKNRRLQANNTSGITGVYRYGNKWVARIKVNRIQINIGTYADFSDAVYARKSAEKEHGFHENHGDK